MAGNTLESESETPKVNSWRPERWPEIAFNLAFETPYSAESKELAACREGIDIGADAILKALRDAPSAVHFTRTEARKADELTGTFTVNRAPGTWVFIPDAVEEPYAATPVSVGAMHKAKALSRGMQTTDAYKREHGE